MFRFIKRFFWWLYVTREADELDRQREREGSALRAAFNCKEQLERALGITFGMASLDAAGRAVEVVGEHISIVVQVFDQRVTVTGPELAIDLLFRTPGNRIGEDHLRIIRGALRELEQAAAGLPVVTEVELTGVVAEPVAA
jgi:hypothetical protein